MAGAGARQTRAEHVACMGSGRLETRHSLLGVDNSWGPKRKHLEVKKRDVHLNFTLDISLMKVIYLKITFLVVQLVCPSLGLTASAPFNLRSFSCLTAWT